MGGGATRGQSRGDKENDAINQQPGSFLIIQYLRLMRDVVIDKQSVALKSTFLPLLVQRNF